MYCSEIRECLKLDPDHKECFQFYKKVKKVNKFNNDAQEQLNNKEYEECIASARKVRKRDFIIACSAPEPFKGSLSGKEWSDYLKSLLVGLGVGKRLPNEINHSAIHTSFRFFDFTS